MRKQTILSTITLALLTCGLAMGAETTPEAGDWTVRTVAVIQNLDVPECVLFDEATGIAYISNIECGEGEYWTDDDKGYVSLLDGDGKVVETRWVDSTPEMILHSPKGMCLLGGYLYFTDNTRLMRCSAKDGGTPEIVAADFEQANDLATDGKVVWVSDTQAGKAYAVTPDGKRREIPAPESINGIAFHGEKMFAVSWDLHEVYELDPSGKAAPVAFGLAEHFTNLDGIEVLDDGTFIVSDFMGNKVCTITPDRKTVHKLVDIESPADIGLDRDQGLLGIPLFMKDKAVILKMTKR